MGSLQEGEGVRGGALAIGLALARPETSLYIHNGFDLFQKGIYPESQPAADQSVVQHLAKSPGKFA